MNSEIDTQLQFEKLIQSNFPSLEPIKKWNQTMWHKDGCIIVSLIFLLKKFKFCFFNNPNIELDKLQRWGTTIYSQNLEYANTDSVDMDKINELIDSTIQVASK